MPNANRFRQRPTSGTTMYALATVGGAVVALAVAFFVGRPGSWTGSPVVLWLIALAVAIVAAALVALNRRADANTADAERELRGTIEDNSRMIQRARSRLAERGERDVGTAPRRRSAGLGS